MRGMESAETRMKRERPGRPRDEAELATLLRALNEALARDIPALFEEQRAA
jgi:hypothetical protein